MFKKLVVVSGLLFLIVGCNSSSSKNAGDNTSPSNLNLTKKILASNVILGEAQAQEGVDTTTKVLASNVVLNTKALRITSTDVQAAFQSIIPDLSSSIIGTWSIKEVGGGYNSSPDFTEEIGTITFNGDSTFSVSLVGDADKKSTTFHYFFNFIATHSITSYTYRVVDNMVLVLRVNSTDLSHPIYNYSLSVIQTTNDKINLHADVGNVILTRQ